MNVRRAYKYDLLGIFDTYGEAKDFMRSMGNTKQWDINYPSLPMILDETRERLNAQGNFPDVTMDVVDGVFWPGFPQTGRNGDRAELEIPGRFQLIGYGPDGAVRSAVSRWEGKTTLGADETSRVDAVTIPMGATLFSLRTGACVGALATLR